MEEKYILSTRTHEDWRNYLIVNSFFFEVLMKQLRHKLGLPLDGLDNVLQALEWEGEKLAKIRVKHSPRSRGMKSGVRIVRELIATEYATRRELFAPIWEIIEKFADLNLSFSLLHAFVLGSTNMSFSSSSRIFMVTSPNDPIEETGIYIKYTPDLSTDDMNQLLKHARESYNTLFTITHESKIIGAKSSNPKVKKAKLKIKQRKTDAPTKSQLELHREVENYLKENYTYRPDSIKMQLVFDAVAKKLNMNRSTLQRSYHALVRNFQLPTSVHTKKIFRAIA